MVKYLNECWTPFHAVDTTVIRLKEKGFVRLSERESWADKIEPMGKYYFTRNASTVVASPTTAVCTPFPCPPARTRALCASTNVLLMSMDV